VDLLGPMFEGHRSPARGREDLMEAPQGPHERAPELASEPVANSTQVEESIPEEILESGGHHDRFYGHAPVRVADLGAPAAPDARSITWDLGQFASDLSPITD
jgi:hypothetical protein